MFHVSRPILRTGNVSIAALAKTVIVYIYIYHISHTFAIDTFVIITQLSNILLVNVIC